MKKYLIAGSRTFNDYNLLLQVINKYEKPDVIIEGGAKGADVLGRRYANENNIECQEYKADWDRYGKSAGYIRNSEMVNQLDKTDKAFIFWDGKSKGTKHTIDLCNKKNIEIIITYF